MSKTSTDSQEKSRTSSELTPTNSNGQWNQQTIYDARNILQMQLSTDVSNTNEQRSGKSEI